MLMFGVLLLFGAILVALLAAQDYVLERQEVFRALRSVRTIELSAQDLRRRELSIPFVKRVLIPTIKNVGSFGRRFTPASVVERLGQEVVYAGSPTGWDAERILAMKLLTTAGGVGLMLLLGARGDGPAAQTIVGMAVFGAIGYYLPEWILRSKSGARQGEIQRTLPDALDLLSITVEAGLGFDAAMSRVSKQAGGPLGEEMYRVIQEMQIGKSRAEALRDLGDRSNVPELKSFVMAMIQADIFGISIAKVLNVQAKEMRIKRRQRAEEKAQKVPIKILFPLLFCIFPSMFVVLLGPAVIRIMEAFAAG